MCKNTHCYFEFCRISSQDFRISSQIDNFRHKNSNFVTILEKFVTKPLPRDSGLACAPRSDEGAKPRMSIFEYLIKYL